MNRFLKGCVNNFVFIASYNPHIPNIDAISGALITLSLSILILDSQCEEGAIDGIYIWYMEISQKGKLSINQTLQQILV